MHNTYLPPTFHFSVIESAETSKPGRSFSVAVRQKGRKKPKELGSFLSACDNGLERDILEGSGG